MDIKEYRHMAMNLSTGEILQTKRGCQLKRAVRRTNRFWGGYNGYSKKWVFTHDGDAGKLLEKAGW